MRLRLPLIAVLVVGSCSAFGANVTEGASVSESSIPPRLTNAFEQSGLSARYSFSKQVNPSYVQGDFNGDGNLDYAVIVTQKDSGKMGIAVLHAGFATAQVLGAGHRVGNGGDDFSWLDAWYVYSKAAVQAGAGEGPAPRLKGDALMLMKTDSASAFVYWTGTRYRWFQQGD